MTTRRGFLWLAATLVVGLAGYLLFWPVPVDPVAWDAPRPPGYVGPHARNERLAGLRHVELAGEEGPEHVAIGPDGKLYAAVVSGAILRMDADGSNPARFATTGGRVLGFDFDAAGRLIAADAMRGLVAIAPDGAVTPLVERIDGEPVAYANSVVVAKDGRIYFTEATRRFPARAYGGTFAASVLDVLEHSATGRLLEFDPATGRVRTLLDDLCFANGVALSADERRVFVNETCGYRVWSVDVAADGASAKAPGTAARVLLDDLPGFPDNLLRGRDGRIWLGFAKPRSDTIDRMADSPFLRRLTLRLPRSMWPVPEAYGHVIAFDESGRIVADLQDPSGAYPETTGVFETPDRLWVASLHAKTLGWLPNPPP